MTMYIKYVSRVILTTYLCTVENIRENLPFMSSVFSAGDVVRFGVDKKVALVVRAHDMLADSDDDEEDLEDDQLLLKFLQGGEERRVHRREVRLEDRSLMQGEVRAQPYSLLSSVPSHLLCNSFASNSFLSLRPRLFFFLRL